MPDGVAFAGNEHLAIVSGSTTVGARHKNERPGVLASSSKVELFDTKEWKTIRTFNAEDNQINCVAGSSDGKLLAVGYGRTNLWPSKIRVFEVSTGKLVKELD